MKRFDIPPGTMLHRLHAALAAALLLCLLSWDSPAQTAGRPPTSDAFEDSLVTLTNRLDQKRIERQRLHRMLGALNTIDSVYKARYPTWVILDEDLKERIHRLFRFRNPETPAEGEVTVVASPSGDELVELSMGGQHFGRIDARTLLSDSLVDEILAASYQRRIVEVNPERPRYNVLTSRPRYAALTASAFGAMLLFQNGFGLEARLGQEEIGYHFWSTGDIQVRALIDRLKLGVILPFTLGAPSGQEREPLSILPRRMTGSTGVTAEYELPCGSEDLATARVSVAEPQIRPLLAQSADPSNVYTLHTTAQATFSHQLALGGEEHLFTLTAGVGYHQVAHVGVTRGDLATFGKQNFVSPLVRVDYVHQGSRLYGMGLQYYDSIIFASCWVEFISDFLFLDLKYYSPVVRQVRPWEQSYFFMISPRLQVVY